MDGILINTADDLFDLFEIERLPIPLPSGNGGIDARTRFIQLAKPVVRMRRIQARCATL
jgi:hypothetical protein